MSQKAEFFAGEGDAWLERNKDKLTGENDPVLAAIEHYKLDPAVVLEIGCANGWRLELLKKKYDCVTWGCDPGYSGGANNILRRSADKTGMSIQCFDVVIYGWCLYLCDPEDYFKIAMEGDRVLADGGYLIIYDFYAPRTYKTPYKHRDGLFSHHFDFSELWLSHPGYSLYGRTIQDKTDVVILKKNMEKAFPEER